MKTTWKVFFSFALCLFLLTSVFNLYVQSSRSSYAEQDYPSATGTSNNANQLPTKAEQSIQMPLQDNLTGIFDGGGQFMDFSSVSGSASFTRHLMCKDYTMPFYDPIDPTTTFSPSDKQAVILTDVNISSTIEFRWYDRDNSSKAWVSCYNWSELAKDLSGYPNGPYHTAAYLSIAGYWRARARRSKLTRTCITLRLKRKLTCFSNPALTQ